MACGAWHTKKGPLKEGALLVVEEKKFVYL